MTNLTATDTLKLVNAPYSKISYYLYALQVDLSQVNGTCLEYAVIARVYLVFIIMFQLHANQLSILDKELIEGMKAQTFEVNNLSVD